MNIAAQIETYINSQPEAKRNDMRTLHQLILALQPGCRLWFLDGLNSEGKVVSNPNIGYGHCSLKQANDKTKEFYQVGISANTTGISVYIFGRDDKKYLQETFGKAIGKATVSGYCIKFKSLKDIQINILEAVFQYGLFGN